MGHAKSFLRLDSWRGAQASHLWDNNNRYLLDSAGRAADFSRWSRGARSPSGAPPRALAGRFEKKCGRRPVDFSDKSGAGRTRQRPGRPRSPGPWGSTSVRFPRQRLTRPGRPCPPLLMCEVQFLNICIYFPALFRSESCVELIPVRIEERLNGGIPTIRFI